MAISPLLVSFYAQGMHESAVTHTPENASHAAHCSAALCNEMQGDFSCLRGIEGIRSLSRNPSAKQDQQSVYVGLPFIATLPVEQLTRA